MNVSVETETRRVAIYERVSTYQQKERGTIKTQADEVVRRLEREPGIHIVGQYQDEAFTGMLPLVERPAGARLLRDLEAGLADEVWVYKVDRLGRDGIDPLGVRKKLARLGVKVCSATEAIEDSFTFAILTALAHKEHEVIRERTTAGMNRAAREGRYTGGIRPYGYRIEGFKETARYVPSDTKILGETTEADVVRGIYHRLGVDQWTCWKVARELNDLGIPTLYILESREVERKTDTGLRKRKTRGHWTAGRIRNMAVNPMYRGCRRYGQRSDVPNRKLTWGKVPALVSDEVWQAAQDTLARNCVRPKNTERIYLLRTVMKCGHCGRTYTGTTLHGATWYRCNGKMRQLEPDNLCPSKGVKGDHLEPQVWADLERWLLDPGDLLDELASEQHDDRRASAREKERVALETALAEKTEQRERLLDALQSGEVTKEDLGNRLSDLKTAQEGLRARLHALEATVNPEDEESLDSDLLARLRARLPELNAQERQEIVRLVVREIRIFTEEIDGKRRARVEIDYRLPEPGVCVVDTLTGMSSSQLPALQAALKSCRSRCDDSQSPCRSPKAVALLRQNLGGTPKVHLDPHGHRLRSQ